MNHTRHMNIFNASKERVTLIGCGGIGAATAVSLAKMGIRFFSLYDPDVVDEVNIATQLHKVSDIGNPKVEAVNGLLHEFSDELAVVEMNQRRFDGEGIENSTIVISAVDSIAARKEIWEIVGGVDVWYLDARMSAEEFHLHTIKSAADRDWYDKVLSEETDENIPDIPCTEKATIYTAFVAAGIIGSFVKKIATKEPGPRYLVYNIKEGFLFP